MIFSAEWVFCNFTSEVWIQLDLYNIKKVGQIFYVSFNPKKLGTINWSSL